ncbi:MAG: hypothetical protein WAP03_19345 [Methylorubrum rhodinum]|uniref:hypothetical protein n=1 Tax=Methylorubrum rhodinum TaxID=29428 RepID=UPI003BB0B650
MLSYTVRQKNGFHGGVCETFQHVVNDGKNEVNLTAPYFGNVKVVNSDTGRWNFYAGGKHLFEVDLDELNATYDPA